MIVYKAINTVNNKIYVGKTIKKLQDRIKAHKYSHKCVKNIYFYRALRQYGFKNFEWKIICKCPTLGELNEREIFYIKELKATNRDIGYNINTGGGGGDNLSNHPNNKEIRKKISKALKGKKMSEEFKIQNRERQVGRKMSSETINNMRKAQKGLTKSKEHREKIRTTLKGREMSNDIKEKISNTLKGRKLTESHKRNIGRAIKGKSISEKVREKIRRTSIIKKCKKVGILGGAFDPVHNGHIDLALYILENTEIQQIWMIPSYSHAYDKEMAPFNIRIELCKIAVQNFSRINVFDCEKNNRNGSTYGLFNYLNNKFPDFYEFKFIIGLDNANTFHKWVNYQYLEKLIPFIVVSRQGEKRDPKVDWYLKKPHKYFDAGKYIPRLSSSELRKLLKTDRKKLLADPYNKGMTRIIEENNLYI